MARFEEKENTELAAMAAVNVLHLFGSHCPVLPRGLT